VISTRPQRNTATKEYLEKRSGERNVDSRIQVQLEEDGGGSTGQSWMETSGLWPMFHRQRQGISQVNQSQRNQMHSVLGSRQCRQWFSQDAV